MKSFRIYSILWLIILVTISLGFKPFSREITSDEIAKVPLRISKNYTLITEEVYRYMASHKTTQSMTIVLRHNENERWPGKKLDSQAGWNSHRYFSMPVDSMGYIHPVENTFAFISHNTDNGKPLGELIDTALARATRQSIYMAEKLVDKPGLLPRTIDANGQLITSNSGWWCSGFFPGILWYLYENNPDPKLKEYAHTYTLRVEDQKYTTTNHDVGFMIFCSFGNAYRITGDIYYRDVIHTASQSLITRFHPTVGCIRSWDYAEWNKQWQYPVIVDNMMNLEMLMWASKAFDNREFANVAIIHANTTLTNHFRLDYSSYHVVSYDTLTGKPECKHTSQGYSHESAWARGQAWGLYGFTMMFRESGDTNYLRQAQAIADFLINHPKMPEDKIPYWDFNAPDIPHTNKDASAGAIMCSALIELSLLSKEPSASTYLKVAETQLHTLCSDEYLAQVGQNGHFILKHSVGHMPNRSEVDVPLTYSDYYFVEALIRYKKRILKNG